jgi:AcrR family transcriptional regulator
MADRRPGRPRDATVEARVPEATQDVLIEVGFDQLTIDAVAERCGMSRATIYRRWNDKTELVVDAAAKLLQSPAVPDTGDLRTDLLECGRAFVHSGERTQRVLVALLAAIPNHPQLRTKAHGPPGHAVRQPVSRRTATRRKPGSVAHPDKCRGHRCPHQCASGSLRHHRLRYGRGSIHRRQISGEPGV